MPQRQVHERAHDFAPSCESPEDVSLGLEERIGVRSSAGGVETLGYDVEEQTQGWDTLAVSGFRDI